MKTVSKKLLSLLLVAFLLVSAIPFQAFATDDISGDPVVLGDDIPVDGTPVDGTPAEGTPAEPIVSDTPSDPLPLDEGGTDDPAPLHTHNGGTPEWVAGTYTHVYKCTGCGEVLGEPETCTVDQTTHKCTKCQHFYDEGHKFTITVKEQKDASCTSEGKTAIMECEICHITTGGDPIPSLGGHDFDADGNCKHEGCLEKRVVKLITLYAGEGHTFSDKVSVTRGFNQVVGEDIPISELTSPLDPNGEFIGWYIKGTNTPLDTTQPYSGDWTELEARWRTTSYKVTFYRILNNQLSTASLITEVTLTPDTNLTQYVNESGLLANEKATHPGYCLNYEKDYPVKKYVNGVFSPLSSSDTAKYLRTVYINLTPATFTLHLNPNGGSVTPTKIENIAFGTTVKLPRPTKSKSVFQGWVDTAGNVYTDSVAFTYTSDTTLTAMWDDEASVLLRIFINGDFTKADRIVQLDGYVAGSKVLRLTSDGSGTPDVTSIIRKYYTASSSAGLSVRGLFKSEADWESFKANQSMSGDPVVTVENNSVISVMVYNAKAGQTIISGGENNNAASGLPNTVPNNGNAYWVVTGKTTGYWVYTSGNTVPQGAYWLNLGNGNGYYVYDPNNYLNGSTVVTVPTYIYIGTNPKTGDTAKIEIAAAIMVLAAAALVTVMALRKKKSV